MPKEAAAGMHAQVARGMQRHRPRGRRHLVHAYTNRMNTIGTLPRQRARVVALFTAAAKGRTIQYSMSARIVWRRYHPWLPDVCGTPVLSAVLRDEKRQALLAVEYTYGIKTFGSPSWSPVRRIGLPTSVPWALCFVFLRSRVSKYFCVVVFAVPLNFVWGSRCRGDRSTHQAYLETRACDKESGSFERVP